MLTNYRPRTSAYPRTTGPRSLIKPPTTIDMLRLDLHSKKNIHREVNPNEIHYMRRKIEKHDEVTNEVFNLMGA